MKLTLTRALAGHAIGDTIDRGEQVARHLIAAGAATEAKQSAPKATKTTSDDQQTRRSQRRTSVRSAKGSDKTAGQSVEQTLEQGGGGPHSSPTPTAG